MDRLKNGSYMGRKRIENEQNSSAKKKTIIKPTAFCPLLVHFCPVFGLLWIFSPLFGTLLQHFSGNFSGLQPNPSRGDLLDGHCQSVLVSDLRAYDFFPEEVLPRGNAL